MDYGFWSVIPPLLTIALAIITKEVLLSLFIGVFTGCLFMTGWNPLAALTTLMDLLVGGYTDDGEYVISGALTDPWNIEVVIIVILLGGLIGLMVRSGGSAAFARMLEGKIKTKKGAQICTWLIGILIFFDDYFNALTNGSIMRPICDRFGISREKTSYIVDSTAVGICLIIPLSSWIAFVCSLIAQGYEMCGLEVDSYKEFLLTIPYNYYAWLSIFMVLICVLLGLDFGPMAKAEKRTQETGVVCEKTFSGGDANEDDFSCIPIAKNGRPVDLLAPILLLVVLALVFILWTGGFFTTFDLLDAVNNMDGMLALTFAAGLSVIFAIIFYSIRRLSKVTESLNAFVAGTKSMLFVILLLAFAWCIGGVCDEMGTAYYLADLFVGNVPATVVPAILFVFACAMTFATGACWGTYAIMVPLAIPLAVAMDISVPVCIATVIGGGGFGAHCSPLADTCILASCSCNIRHTDHVKTQIPYSVTCACCATVGYLVSGFVETWILPLAVTFGCFIVAVLILSKIFHAEKYEIENVGDDAVRATDTE